MNPVTVVPKSSPRSATPTRTHPRKWRSLADLYRASSAIERYTFTPEFKTKIPRAWERKPSTPFAPRNESQKIWKRYEFRDPHFSGALQSKATETHAIKKLRLEGQETKACITSWDQEINETRHKELSNHDVSAIKPQIPTKPIAANLEGKNLGRAQETDADTTSLYPSQNAVDQEIVDENPAGQRTASVFAENPGIYMQSLPRPNSGNTPMQASPIDEPSVAEQPDSGKKQGITLQKLYEHFKKPVNAISSQGVSLSVYEAVRNIANGGLRGEEEEMTAVSPAKDYISGEEQMGPTQVVHRTAASAPEAVFDQALKSSTAIGWGQRTAHTERQTLHLHAHIADATIIRYVTSGGLEDKIRNGLTQQLGDTEKIYDKVTTPKPSHQSNTAAYEKAKQSEDTGPESIHKEQLEGHEFETKQNVEEEDTNPESPAHQDLPMQGQDPPSSTPAFFQDEDTDYLHAFLTRTKVRKAAREVNPQNFDRFPHSPMTRSRAALLPLSTNSPSPKKANKHQLETTYESEPVETNQTGSPRRRSGRTRLPRPQKAPTITLSTIPVRRSNGTELVFLQSTDTAQIALATRANTKRNKGEAVMPKMKLQALSQAHKSPSKSPRLRKGKEVSWKDEPTYFGMQADDAKDAGKEPKADEYRRARKVRRSGAVNGAPAPKKALTEDATSVRRRMPRTRGKVGSLKELSCDESLM